MASKTLLIIIFAVIAITAASAYVNFSSQIAFPFSSKVALIKIEGEISSSESIIPIGRANPESIEKLLEKANSNPSIRAVLLEINSPGGSPVASDEIAKAVERMNKTVVAYIRDSGASGAYWVAASADKIVSHPLSITCSIGAFTTTADLSGFFGKIGLNYTTLKSGELKDIGTMNRPLTDKEKELLQEMVNEINNEFVEQIKSKRNLTDWQISKLKDGRPCLGKEALKYGLVDKLGNKEDAILLIKETEKMKKRPQIVEMREEVNFLSSIFSSAFSKSFYLIGRGFGDSLVEKQVEIVS